MDDSSVNYSKGQKFSLSDYAHSKQVVQDLPKLISIYSKLIPVLEQYQCYTGAAQVLELVRDSKKLLEVQHDYYKKIYKSKGKLTDE